MPDQVNRERPGDRRVTGDRYQVSEPDRAAGGRGRSYAQPGAARRAALTGWAAALGIRLGEEYHQDSRITTITGTAKRERTRHGSATITLTGDIWED